MPIRACEIRSRAFHKKHVYSGDEAKNDDSEKTTLACSSRQSFVALSCVYLCDNELCEQLCLEITDNSKLKNSILTILN